MFANNTRLVCQLALAYLGVKLGRSVTYKQNLDTLSAKVAAHGAVIRRHAGTTWTARTTTLSNSTLAMVFTPK